MLRLLNKEENRTVDLYVIDAHHHLGKEENIKNLNPSGPDGSYYFLRSILFGNQWKAGLIRELEENGDEYAYSIPGKAHRPTAQPSMIRALVGSTPPFGGIDASPMFDNTAVVDRIVAFPMHDEYREKEVEHYTKRGEPTPRYAFSNNKIAKITSRYPHSLRYFPYGRVHPFDTGACHEISRAVEELGIAGFKLHPKSDDWEIRNHELVEIFKTTSRYGVPTIFHTSFLSEVVKIHETIGDTIEELVRDSGIEGMADWDRPGAYRELGVKGKKELVALRRRLSGLRVIIGHCGWHSSPELFRMFSNPHLFGEVSGIKGQVVGNLFRAALKFFDPAYFHENTLPDLDIGEGLLRAIYANTGLGPIHTRWSNKLMFGSDYPFLDQIQAIDVLRSLLMKDFPGTERDIANFLGISALRVNPPTFSSPHVIRSLSVPDRPAVLTLGFGELREELITALLDNSSNDSRKAGTVYLDPLIDTFPLERVRFDDNVLTLMDREGHARVFRLTPALREPGGEDDLLGLAKWLGAEDIARISGRFMPLSADNEAVLFETMAEADMDTTPDEFMTP